MAPPGVAFSNVFLETVFSPGISAEMISIAPSVSGMLGKKPYGSIELDGFLNGNVSATVKKGQATEAGAERQRVIIEAKDLNLGALREMMKWTTAIDGKVAVSADGQADLGLSEQPDVDLNLEVDKFALPPATVNTMMGPLTLPDMKLTKLQLKGRLTGGKFIIETGDVGAKKDELHGKITGSWSVQLSNIGGRPQPQLGAYDLTVDLVADKTFQTKASLFLSLLDQYKSTVPEGARYRFKVSASDLQSPPNITNAQ